MHGRLIQQKAGSGLTAVLATEKQFFVCASKIELFLPIIRISDVSSWVAATKAMRLALFTSSNASQFAPCKKFVSCAQEFQKRRQGFCSKCLIDPFT